MAIRRRLKGLSKETKRLLKTGETDEVDFKEKPASVTMDDFVAFANAPDGGTLLLGVSEGSAEDGSQQGTVKGCAIDDNTVLSLLNKALECIPPIKISLVAENTSENPILRVVVEKSEVRPHSTRKGIYCVRDGSRNRPLLPTELLSIFLEKEASVFQERFEKSVESIEDSFDELGVSLNDTIETMANQLGWTDFKLDDTEDVLSRILYRIANLEEKAKANEDRMKAIFEQDERSDPVKLKKLKEFRDQLKVYLCEDSKRLNAALNNQIEKFNVSGDIASDFKEEELAAQFSKVVEELRRETSETQK